MFIIPKFEIDVKRYLYPITEDNLDKINLYGASSNYDIHKDCIYNFEGIKFLMERNVQPGTYTLMMLCGAELGRDQAIRKYEMKSKYRILPKQFGEYENLKTLEIERICVSTNTMSQNDYLECRNFSFITKLLANKVFSPIYIMLKNLDISWFDFSIKINELIIIP